MDVQSSYRVERISELVRRELMLLFNNNINDNRLKKINITDVIVSKDLREAKVFFSVAHDYQKISLLLANAQGFLRKNIAKSLKLRHTPELHFIYDATPKTANRIDSLLAKL